MRQFVFNYKYISRAKCTHALVPMYLSLISIKLKNTPLLPSTVQVDRHVELVGGKTAEDTIFRHVECASLPPRRHGVLVENPRLAESLRRHYASFLERGRGSRRRRCTEKGNGWSSATITFRYIRARIVDTRQDSSPAHQKT